MNEDNKITIIIADDNTEWSKAMQKYLQQFKEFEILGITFDGEEQIQMIKTLQPDIVITDLKRKKGISGLDVIQKCQEMQLTKTKFIVETGAYYKEQINVLISMGIKYILFKPYTLDDLENKINAVSDAIASKTESNFIGSIKDVYKFVPELLDKYYQDKNIIRMKYVKSYLLDSLYFYIVGDKQNSISSIELAEKQYLELINDKSYLEENSYKVNRDYVTIQEMKIAVQNGELKTVIQKYLDTLTF